MRQQGSPLFSDVEMAAWEFFYNAGPDVPRSIMEVPSVTSDLTIIKDLAGLLVQRGYMMVRQETFTEYKARWSETTRRSSGIRRHLYWLTPRGRQAYEILAKPPEQPLLRFARSLPVGRLLATLYAVPGHAVRATQACPGATASTRVALLQRMEDRGWIMRLPEGSAPKTHCRLHESVRPFVGVYLELWPPTTPSR